MSHTYIGSTGQKSARAEGSESACVLPDIKANVLTPCGTGVPYSVADFLPRAPERTNGIEVSITIGP